MKIVKEDLWSVDVNDTTKTCFVVTTSASLKQNSELVMGRGAAFDAVKRYGVYIRTMCGVLVKRHIGKKNFLTGGAGGPSLENGTPLPADDHFAHDERFYGFICVSASIPAERHSIPEEFGIFQTKRDWWEHARLDVIEKSTAMLTQHAKHHPDWKYRLNFPGIGNGHLAEEQVLPLLQGLPDNVTICRR